MFPNTPVHYYTKWNGSSQYETYCFIGNFTELSTQQIKVGSNLLDFHENILDGDFYTGIVGFGAETEIEKYGRKVRYWVPESGSSENSKIFWNNTLKDLYGQKVGVFYWDDITSVSALESRCQSVASSMKLKKELSCSVFDLSKISNADRLEIGEGVVVMTMRNGSYIGELFYITKIERNLTDPSQDNLTMKNYN